MADYRLWFIGADGKLESSRSFVCSADADAVVWAEQMMDYRSVELWSGDRLVKRLFPSDQCHETVTHVLKEGRLIPKKGTEPK